MNKDTIAKLDKLIEEFQQALDEFTEETILRGVYPDPEDGLGYGVYMHYLLCEALDMEKQGHNEIARLHRSYFDQMFQLGIMPQMPDTGDAE